MSAAGGRKRRIQGTHNSVLLKEGHRVECCSWGEIQILVLWERHKRLSAAWKGAGCFVLLLERAHRVICAIKTIGERHTECSASKKGADN